MAKWDALFAMFDDIQLHVARTGAKIVAYDEPKRLVIGFRAEDSAHEWEIGLRSLRDAHSVDPERFEAIREHVMTCDGRKQLAQMLSEGKRV